jgi:hypothetical protein
MGLEGKRAFKAFSAKTAASGAAPKAFPNGLA